MNTRIEPANDPRMIPTEPRVLHYTVPLALVVGTAALAFIGWLVNQDRFP